MKQVFILTAFLPFLLLFKREGKLSTKKGKLSFASVATDHANIKAVSNSANCIIDKKTGDIEFTVTIDDFKFDEQGLQEIFSKQVMESKQFPTAGFKGIVANLHTVDFAKNGDQSLPVKGTLTLHGVAKNLETTCWLKIKNNTVQATAEFQVNMKDHKIENPIDNDNIKIAIDCLLENS